MSRYVFTTDARADIEQIYEYITERSPQSALMIVERIEDVCQMLADYPYSGVARPEFGSAHRSFPVPSSGYMVIYRPIEDYDTAARTSIGCFSSEQGYDG